MDNEIWRYLVINGMRTDWSISNFGFIKNEKGELVNQYPVDGGYFMVSYKGNPYLVHRLVAYNFITKDLHGMHVHHVNHCPWDNRVANLEVLTPSEHARVDNQLSEATVAKIASDILENKLPPRKIAEKYAVPEYTVRSILHKTSYVNYLTEYDFSNYKFLRDPSSKEIVAFAVDLYDNKDYDSKEVLKAIIEKYDISNQKAYYYNSEAKKLIKKDNADARFKYKDLYGPLDDLIMKGAKYDELLNWLEANTNLSYDDSRYLIERRVNHHRKVLRKINK